MGSGNGSHATPLTALSLESACKIKSLQPCRCVIETGVRNYLAKA